MSETKLARHLGVAPEPASDERIRAAGTHPGFASPMGLDPDKVRLVIDHSVTNAPNLTVGANEADYHCNNFNLARDLPGTEAVDIVQAREGDLAPDGTPLSFAAAFEVGRVRQAVRAPVEAGGVRYDDEEGSACVPALSVLTLNLDRLMAGAVEVSHDEYGPIWPRALAPWDLHLCALSMGSADVAAAADELYARLCGAGIEVLYDDRGGRPGVQFAEADLLGIPLRLIVGARGLENGEVEWKRRATGERGAIPLDGAVAEVRKMLAGEHEASQ